MLQKTISHYIQASSGDCDSLHKGVIDGDNKHLAGALEVGVVNVRGNVLGGAGAGEGAGHANNVAVALLELLGQVDLAGSRVLEQLEAWELVPYLDKGPGRGVEATRNGGACQGNSAEGQTERHCQRCLGLGRYVRLPDS